LHLHDPDRIDIEPDEPLTPPIITDAPEQDAPSSIGKLNKGNTPSTKRKREEEKKTEKDRKKNSKKARKE
jgi:hypothetical protein